MLLSLQSILLGVGLIAGIDERTQVLAITLQAFPLTSSSISEARAEEVKKKFIESYDAYRKYAFGHDDLKPISRTFADTRNGWGATMVDALDTMQIMGLREYYQEAIEQIAKTDFTRTRTDVNVFESTIRYLAGLLSAYELSGKRDEVLLQKAVQLGDKLAGAWEGANVLPWTTIYFDQRPPLRQGVSVSAASLILEMHTLTKHTGNATYLQLAEKAQNAILAAPSSFPGLLPNSFWPPTGTVRNQWATWGSGCDSAQEYLLKYYLLTGDQRHLSAWRQAVRSSISHLLVESTKGHSFLVEWDGKRLVPDAAHLTTFAAGNWLLGARATGDADYRDRALHLLDSAWATHDLSPHGFGPDEYRVNIKGAQDTLPRRHRRQAQMYGFHCTRCGYMLRPETVESNFYAWRLTGDPRYQERAWRFVQDLKKLQVTSGGFAGIRDVFSKSQRRIDHTESFFYSETLKYLYLTFRPLLNLDHYVFNTEAHPFAVSEAPEDAFSMPTSLVVLPVNATGARGSSLHVVGGLLACAMLVALVHLVSRVRARRDRPPLTLRRMRFDGIAGTGGIGKRSKGVNARR